MHFGKLSTGRLAAAILLPLLAAGAAFAAEPLEPGVFFEVDCPWARLVAVDANGYQQAGQWGAGHIACEGVTWTGTFASLTSLVVTNGSPWKLSGTIELLADGVPLKTIIVEMAGHNWKQIGIGSALGPDNQSKTGFYKFRLTPELETSDVHFERGTIPSITLREHHCELQVDRGEDKSLSVVTTCYDLDIPPNASIWTPANIPR